MHKPNNATQCDEPRCICCRGYEAVKTHEAENGIHVETIELNHERNVTVERRNRKLVYSKPNASQTVLARCW